MANLVSTTRDGLTYLLKIGNNLLETGSDIVRLPEGIGCVDLGTLTYTYNTDGHHMFATRFEPKEIGVANLLCNRYKTTTSRNGGWEINDGEIGGSVAYDWLYINDSSYTSAADFKAAVSGVLLFYKKAIS